LFIDLIVLILFIVCTEDDSSKRLHFLYFNKLSKFRKTNQRGPLAPSLQF